MGAPDILARLAAAGIRLTPLPDGRLWAEPRTALNDDLRSLIVEHKAEILAALEPATVAHQHRVQEFALQMRLYADRNGFTQADFEEAMQVALAGDTEGWLAYIKSQNETRH